MSKQILVVGSLNVDFVFKTDRLPKSGESLHGAEFSIFPGGKGANQAVAIARLGGEVQLIGRVGKDPFGTTLVDNVRSNAVGVTHIITDAEKHTGTALIVVDKQGNNSILVAQGANYNWSPEDIRSVEPILKASDYLLLQLEISELALDAVVNMARVHGVPVILDAGPARAIETSLLAGLEIVSPNETEAEALTGIPVSDLPTARRAAERLLALGAKNVVVKLGERGCLVAGAAGEVHVPGLPVAAVDTTAAGDAFTGALVLFLSYGLDLSEAARQANYVGALTVTKMGAQPSLPSALELERLLGAQGQTAPLPPDRPAPHKAAP